MIGRVFGILVFSAFLTAVYSGNINELSAAATSCAKDAVDLVIALAGSMCLWSGIANVLDRCGFTCKLQKFISPLLKIIYPTSHRNNRGINEAAANISANFLGLGNAALPLGIESIKKINSGEKDKTRASDDAVMFAVLATTPFQLLPVTLSAMREAHGSAAPYEILIPVWICEIGTTAFAVIICRLMAKIFR